MARMDFLPSVRFSCRKRGDRVRCDGPFKAIATRQDLAARRNAGSSRYEAGFTAGMPPASQRLLLA